MMNAHLPTSPEENELNTNICCVCGEHLFEDTNVCEIWEEDDNRISICDECTKQLISLKNCLEETDENGVSEFLKWCMDGDASLEKFEELPEEEKQDIIRQYADDIYKMKALEFDSALYRMREEDALQKVFGRTKEECEKIIFKGIYDKL